MSEFEKGVVKVEVQRLTVEQMIARGLLGYIPDGETRIVAMALNKDGEVYKGKIMKEIDQERFLHGNDNDHYYFEVLNQARELFGFEKLELE